MNGFLLDTNVISELTRPRPDSRVAAWLDSADEEQLFLSVLTLGEIRKGIAMVADSSRKVSLEIWLNRGLIARFEGRILGIDPSIADRWGQISGLLARRGTPLPVVDGLLAATALHHNLTLVTRNIRDVASTGTKVLDPWN
ncbi:MAG: type II toxin-antitoxin system VapC family toxin [Terriglobales bacterium]